MTKKINPAKVLKVLLALCLVLSLSSAFLCMNAFADGIIIVGGSDTSSDSNTGGTGGTTGNNTGSVVVVGGNGGKVTITKSPTSETVEKGGTAVFVARADNADGLVWRLVSPDASNTINAKAAPSEFSGLWVDGTNTDTLTLGNIPDSLNGWYVECKFEGNGGPVYTGGAKITVTGATGTTNDPSKTGGNQASATTTNTQNAQPVLPTITSQPKGATMVSGQVTSLSVTATTTDDSTLNYQWYASTTNSTTSGTPIAGAISAQYQPREQDGNMFYYVAVWGTKDGQTGTKIFSTPVEVRYNSTNTGSNTNNYNGGVINQPSQVVIDAGPSGGNAVNNNPGNANTTPADRNGTPVSQPAQNTANADDGNGGSTAVVMLVIALVALVACLGLVVKSGLLTKK